MMIKTADGWKQLQGHYGPVAMELRGPSEANVPEGIKNQAAIAKAFPSFIPWDMVSIAKWYEGAILRIHRAAFPAEHKPAQCPDGNNCPFLRKAGWSMPTLTKRQRRDFIAEMENNED